MHKPSIIYFYFFVLLTFLAGNSFAQTSWSDVPARKEKKLISFTANIDTVVCNNQSLKGDIVFINFWFAGCPPCVSELAEMNTLYNKLKDKQNFQFISFSFDPEETINMMVDLYKIKYPVFHLSKEDIKKMNFGKGFPLNFIVDGDGYIVYMQYSGGDKKNSNQIINKEIYPAILRFIEANNTKN